MNSAKRRPSRLDRLLGILLAWVLWIIPAARNAFDVEPEWIWNTHEVVDSAILGLGVAAVIATPAVMAMYDVGTAPLRIAATIGIYLAFGLVYYLHD